MAMQRDYDDGPGQPMPRGEGYASGPEETKPRWSPTYSDDFDEGVARLNTVFLTGYLGQDPKPRYFDSGKVVLNLSLAVKREYHPLERKAKNVAYGEEETDWFQLEMWNRDAEYAAKVCKKGGRVGVTGPLSINEWSDREGNPRSTVKILVNNLELLDSRAEQASRSDRSEDNLWESEKLQKRDDEARRRTEAAASAAATLSSGTGGADGGGVGTGGAYQSSEDLEAKARKKEAEDKWWSAEPAAASTRTSTEAGAGGGLAGEGEGGASGGLNWWDEDGGSAGGGGEGERSKGFDADSLPSFFDD